MSTTIQMPPAFDAAVRSVCTEAINQAVNQLAAKYGFDCEDAMRDLNLGEIKLVRKRGPSPKQETEKSATKPKKTKKGKDPNAPKRAKTGYLLFQDNKRDEVRSKLLAELEVNTKLKPQDVVKEIALLWSDLGDEEKAEWARRGKEAVAKVVDSVGGSSEDEDDE